MFDLLIHTLHLKPRWVLQDNSTAVFLTF